MRGGRTMGGARWIAITREISDAMAACELTHLERQPIDVELARRQHRAYEDRLRAAGCSIERLPSTADMPDAVFVEDIAVVLDEIAVITRPGALSRRVETAVVAGALARHRPLVRIEPPGTMDGGDVLVAGRRIFVGESSRTNRTAIDQLRAIVAPFGYSVEAVEVRGCLHLKSAATVVGQGLLLANPAWLPLEPFAAFERIDVDPAEPTAANALTIGSTTIYPEAFPRTLERLVHRGVHVTTVDASEVAKAEGAVTCCSLVFQATTP